MESFWNNRPTLITGGSGFIGAHIVSHLVEKGAEVFCLVRDPDHARSLDLLSLRDKITLIPGTIVDLGLLQSVLSDCHIKTVFHLAGQSLLGEADRSPIDTFETNIRGTYVVLEACRRNSKVESIVVASSERVYGNQSGLPFNEGAPLLGLLPYDVSKVCADVLSQSFARTFQVPVALARSTNTYGGGDLNFSRIIPGTILSILRNEDPILRSDGTPVRDFIHVSDAVRGYVILAENIESTKGEAFNLGSGHPVSMRNLVELLIRLMGKESELRAKIAGPTETPDAPDAQYVSSTKIETLLGWCPTTGLEEGLRQSIEWYRTHFGSA